MRVAIARKHGKRCRFARPSGRFGPPRSCLRTSYLSARARRAFRLTYRPPLPRGRYLAWARGIDRAGNVERKARLGNAKRFRVR